MYGFADAIGVNCESEQEAQKWAGLRIDVRFDCDESAGGIAAGSCFEFMKAVSRRERPYRDRTNFLDRAMFRFETMGFKFDRSQDKFSDRGDLKRHISPTNSSASQFI